MRPDPSVECESMSSPPAPLATPEPSPTAAPAVRVLAAPRGAPPTAAAFLFIFITVALDMLALGVMIPVLPKLIVEFEHGDIANAAGVSGVFGFTWAAMQFAFSPLMGALSDRRGRRPVILLSNLGMGLDYLLMAAAPSLSWLFVGRLVSGITSANLSTAYAYIADVTPEDERAAKFGMLGAAFGLGFVVGPALGGVLGSISLRLPFWAAAGLSLTNAVYGFFILPESLPIEKRASFAWAKANPLGSLTLLRSHPRLLGLALVAFLYNIAHDSLPSVFVLYADYRYQWGERMVGICLAAVGIASTIVSAVFVGPLVKRLGERSALLMGLGFGVLGFGMYGWAPTGAWFLAGIPFISLWGIASPAFQALMSRRVEPSEQGRLQGALASMSGVTGMIGPLLFTQIFAFGISSSTLHLPGSPYWLASALLLASLTVAFAVAKEAKAKASEAS
jgi:DHA1 family tetracycline resistance protein-like MFS transporter